MSNLEALKKKHAELGEEIARLEKQVNYNDHPHLFVADHACEEWHCLEQDAYGCWRTYDSAGKSKQPVFRTKEIAEAHAQAQEIVHRVKAMGVAYVELAENWAILCTNTGSACPAQFDMPSDLMFGCFGTGDEGKIRAQHAIDTVGEDNIAWAARVLAGGSIER